MNERQHETGLQPERRDDVIRKGHQAHELLDHPILARYFADGIDTAFNEFCTLKPDCKDHELRELHLKAQGLILLRATLEKYVADRQWELDKSQYAQEGLMEDPEDAD